MSGKFETNRAARRSQAKKTGQKPQKRDNTLLCAVIALLMLILVVLIIYALSLERREAPAPNVTGQSNSTDPFSQKPTTDSKTDPTTAPTEDFQIQVDPDMEFDLDRGLKVTDVGSYSGVYMEDGSDELVSRVLMAVVTNTSDQDLEYAEITLTGGGKEAKFTISTLPAGTSAVLLEKTRMEYPGKDVFETAVAANIAFFDAPMSLCENVLKIQSLDGAINITNISDEDITGDIVVYYKNSSADMFYGGITYRVRLAGGLKAGEIRQIMSDHYSTAGSTILFVTYAQ